MWDLQLNWLIYDFGGREASVDEAREALTACADILLLDNFSLDDLRAAVALTAGRAKLEASGGIDISQLRSVAETGVDFISAGSLTKHVKAVDLSMRFELDGIPRRQ